MRVGSPILSVGLSLLALLTTACTSNDTAQAVTPDTDLVARGQYLVNYGGCNDCHTPKVLTPTGPVPDSTRLLSGHRAGSEMPAIPAGVLRPGGWAALTDMNNTVWAGPWGVSFSANLTPDATGLAAWTDEQFVQTMRTGKHMGTGRALLPPMPWFGLANLTDEDLHAVFAYLRSLKPVSNAVPAPVPPSAAVAAR